MASFSISHWVVVMLILLILFGKGRIPDVMADLGKGLRSFREGLADSDEVDVTAVAQTESRVRTC